MYREANAWLGDEEVGYFDGDPTLEQKGLFMSYTPRIPPADVVNLTMFAERSWPETKDETFSEMCREGRLPLRRGALAFMDECLTHSNPNVRVLLVGETASSPGEGVLSACLTQMGELRAAGVSVAGSPETLAGEDNYEDALYKRVERDKKKKKGELMVPEVGGDLQRQNFSSDVVIDSSMFSTSRRSSLTKAAIRTASEQRGFDVDFDVIFVGASNSTCKAATEAGAHSVVVRTSEQRGAEGAWGQGGCM